MQSRSIRSLGGAVCVGILFGVSGSAVGAGDVLEFAAPDGAALAAEDAAREAQGLAPRFAVREEVNITPDNAGVWRDLDKRFSSWTLRISSRGAENINLGFLGYELPDFASLHISATDGSVDVRPFTSADNKAHGQLWTPVLGTDDVTIELVVPTEARHKVSLHLGYVNLGYRPFGERPAETGRDGACNVDVVCPEGDAWADEIDSVAVISTGGSTFCTGFMVNNVEQDRTPYFMTAYHCGVRSGDAPSLVAYWNYENSTCRPPGSGASGGPGDGTLSDFSTGSTLRAEGAASDFTLVELDRAPDEEFEVSFSGWDARFYEPVGVVGIHHPRTDEKRISFEYDQTASTVGLTSSPEVPVNDSTHLKVRDWDLGTTEPGSSGSPIYDLNTQRVLGQLHGGGAACGNDLYDGYGRIARSWDNGAASSSLKPWLDPNDTGVLFVDTLPANGLVVSPTGENLSIGVVGGPFSNDSVVYDIENSSGGSLDYKVSIAPGATAPVLLNGGTGDVLGTLADGDAASVTVSLASSAAGLAAGVYEAEIVFEDQTGGVSVSRLHTLEVGQTGLSITPEADLFDSGAEGGPFDAELTYQIESTRPTPVDVEITASEPWISLDLPGGSSVVTLNGVGDTALVTVGFSSSANALPAGLAEGVVTFENLTDGNGSTTRTATLDVGRFRYLPDDVAAAMQ